MADKGEKQKNEVRRRSATCWRVLCEPATDAAPIAGAQLVELQTTLQAREQEAAAAEAGA